MAYSPRVVDPISGGILSVDNCLFRIHAGKNFRVLGEILLDKNITHNIIGSTPDTPYVHFLLNIVSTGEAIVRAYEGVTYSGGTQLKYLNKNRNKSDIPDFNMLYTPTSFDISGAFELFEGRISNGKGVGGTDREFYMWVLKLSTDYLIQIESKESSNYINFIFDWYEFIHLN